MVSLRIAHVSTADTDGGAARSAYRLHTQLRVRGYDSTMFVRDKQTDDTSVVRFNAGTGVFSRIRQRLHRLERSAQLRRGRPNSRYEMFSLDKAPHQSLLLKQLPESDIVNLHWVSGFIDISSFLPAVSRERPVVWRLSDMNPFTGGCHYDGGCGRYSRGCGFCPQLYHLSKSDLSSRIWSRKQRAFDQLDVGCLVLVAQSNWMAERVSRSPLLSRFRTVVIPNGVDAEIYSPKDKYVVRSILGVPPGAKVILFTSDYLSHGRKGFRILIEAISGLKANDRPLLLTAGSAPPDVPAGVAHLHFGHVSDMRLLSNLYSAADLFVFPSVQDNCPNTVLEAMACGTPVVGFATSGVPELVQDGVTGLLASAVSPAALAGVILDALNDRQMLESMGQRSRQLALQKYNYQLQVSSLLRVYDQLVNRKQ